MQSQGQDQMLEDDMNAENEEFSKLKGITVTLTPYRDSELCQNNDDPNMTNMSSTLLPSFNKHFIHNLS